MGHSGNIFKIGEVLLPGFFKNEAADDQGNLQALINGGGFN